MRGRVVVEVELELDASVDMAYMRLASGSVASTIELESEALKRSVRADLDHEGHVLGFEFDGARALLPPGLLERRRSVID